VQNGILILTGQEVLSLLNRRESEIVDVVRKTYEAHAKAETELPHSSFLRFPDDSVNRIISLPAYVGADFKIAGIKWIASFPGNLKQGLDRASAVIVINSVETGRPRAILEGSIISAKRTAASAALAARTLHKDRETSVVGVIGCGLINFEIVRFLSVVLERLQSLIIYDCNPERAHPFINKCRGVSNGIEVKTADRMEKVFESCSLVSIATTAVSPHITDLSLFAAGGTILHISLRDLSPEIILSCDNIVDDIDHVLRAQTSVHLAEQLVGHRDFIRGNLADILMDKAQSRKDKESIVVFSPFGLGILDLALAKLACDLAEKEGKGRIIDSFLPDSWLNWDQR
jgi:N-[(2S)-2-amino-2-carboxyethyl]-L-glutamate dehydrogenase